MRLLFRHSFRRNYCGWTLTDNNVKWVRDRGLDHAVEREKNLKPLLNIKNLIKSEPSKSLPLSIITQQKDSLEIPFRPIDFVRKYPSVFQEFLPGNIGVQPHIKLTPEVLNLDAEEQLVYQRESYKQAVADRLLKLLMISRINKLPVKLVDMLKWDLGLPDDYARSIIPEFPDYFRVVDRKDEKFSCFGSQEIGELELVCWSNELAISATENRAMDREKIVFSMKFSNGFEMDKKMKKWLDDWQKLPYISPYENAAHLLPKSDESDKWVVAILHEVINLFGAKKVERENLLCLGEYLGIRSRFKRALLSHPGIFYVSSKIGRYTVVLKEAYKRGTLVDSDPLMNVRSQYIHLMNKVKEDRKVVADSSGSKEEKGIPLEARGEEDDSEEEKDAELYELSGSEEEGAVDDGCRDDYDEDEEKDKNRRGTRKSSAVRRENSARDMNLSMKRDLRSPERGKSRCEQLCTNKEKVPRVYLRTEKRANDVWRDSGERLNSTRSRRRSLSERDSGEMLNSARSRRRSLSERGSGELLNSARSRRRSLSERRSGEMLNSTISRRSSLSERGSGERLNSIRSRRRSLSEKKTSV